MKIVAICGIDGSGKTTQIKMLEDFFTKEEVKTYFTKSPTDWYRNDLRVREYLRGELEENSQLIDELALLSACDKLRQYQLDIMGKEYEFVFFDRYIYSAYAYFMCRGMSLERIEVLNSVIPKPDITIYIDVDEKLAYNRILVRDEYTRNIEEGNILFLKKVRDIFLRQPWGENKSYHIVDGECAKEQVFSSILHILNEYR